jgi:hypothetical protein
METWIWVAAAAVVAVVVVTLLFWLLTRNRERRLRDQFGPEYERTVEKTGSRSRAEDELEERERQVERLDIRPLSREQHRFYIEEWTAAQARFVDDPGEAVGAAERLIAEVMKVRGYRAGDFEQQAADVSVHHPEVVENYRYARRVSVAYERGQATTDDLRQAVMHYRALFAELLEPEGARK